MRGQYNIISKEVQTNVGGAVIIACLLHGQSDEWRPCQMNRAIHALFFIKHNDLTFTNIHICNFMELSFTCFR